MRFPLLVIITFSISSAARVGTATSLKMIRFEGSNFLRQRLVLSILSGEVISISEIRDQEENPGLKEYEANLLKLIDKLTNGTTMKINATGTSLYMKPGILTGGKIEHTCNDERSIGYLLEVLFCLAPFCKERVHATLKGVTDNRIDPSVDYYRLTSLPLLRSFGVLDELELKLIKRGFAPNGDGEVMFTCPNPKKLRPLQHAEQGKIKKIRGVAYACRVSPQIPNRIIESARSVLNSYIPDIYIYSDHRKGNNSGKSPGFGLLLTAETTTGVVLAIEDCSNPKGQGDAVNAEDLGKATANKLLREIYKGGCVDPINQPLAALLMTLCEPDVSKVVTGSLTQYTIEFLRHLKLFFGTMFKLEHKSTNHDDIGGKLGGDKVLLTAVGIGYSNINKTMR